MSVREKLSFQTYHGEIDFTVREVSEDKAVAVMPVGANMLNPFGTVHAGAMIWFADMVATLCAVGDFSSVDDEGRGFPLAIDLHTVLIANQRDGELTATARPVRRGKQLVVVRTEVTGKDGRLLIDVTTTHTRAG